MRPLIRITTLSTTKICKKMSQILTLFRTAGFNPVPFEEEQISTLFKRVGLDPRPF